VVAHPPRPAAQLHRGTPAAGRGGRLGLRRARRGRSHLCGHRHQHPDRLRHRAARGALHGGTAQAGPGAHASAPQRRGEGDLRAGAGARGHRPARGRRRGDRGPAHRRGLPGGGGRGHPHRRIHPGGEVPGAGPGGGHAPRADLHGLQGDRPHSRRRDRRGGEHRHGHGARPHRRPHRGGRGRADPPRGTPRQPGGAPALGHGGGGRGGHGGRDRLGARPVHHARDRDLAGRRDRARGAPHRRHHGAGPGDVAAGPPQRAHQQPRCGGDPGRDHRRPHGQDRDPDPAGPPHAWPTAR
jgi:hypothetical protein